MKRFYHGHSFSWIKQFVAIGIFALVFCAFFAGISNMSEKTADEQAASLKTAISRSIAHCYATEGHYPESLSALQEDYGITYDTDRYFVDYQVLGQNIFPDVTIIVK